jgi:hypothetical protein
VQSSLKPQIFFSVLIIAALIVVGTIYALTSSRLNGLIRMPTPGQETASQIAAAQAKAAKKRATCVSAIKNQWDPIIKLAQSENLPVTSYQAQETQLENKCS